LFEKIGGYDRKKVVMNVHGSWRNYALMLDLPIDTPLQQIFHELVKKSERFPISSKVVDRAPLKETILTKNINIFEILPVFRVNDYDGGPYLPAVVMGPRV
jgi:UbiD family decarboxylase